MSFLKTIQLISFSLLIIFLFQGMTINSFEDEPIVYNPPNPNQKEFNLFIEVVSGTLAGMISCFTFYPLECIEAKLQVMSGKKKPAIPKSTIDIVKNIVRQEGVSGLYQGVTPTVIGNAVNWGVYFSIYRFTNHYLNTQSSIQSTMLCHSLSAINAGIITTAVVNPFWVLKIRLATSNRYSGMKDAFTSILRNEGVSGFWKGVGPSFLGVSEGLVQFVTYEQILERIRINNNGNISVPGYLMAGGTARMIAGLVTYPYLLLRSTMQSDNCQYTSISDAISKIYKQEGMKGFYRGLGPNLLRSVPPAAMMLYIVEFFRNTLTTLVN